MSRLLGSASCVGFSGSRSVPCEASDRAVRSAVAALRPDCRVLVGCASGVDELVRSLVPAAEVFQVSFAGRGAFAARSVAFVRAVAAAGGVLCAFPASSCPVGLVPSSVSGRCFSGRGSGTWATLAFAIGLGVPCLVFVPGGVEVPDWGFVAGGRGWFFLSGVRQLSLL